MSVSLLNAFTVSLWYTEMITTEHAAALARRKAQGLDMDNFPQPQQLLEAPMLSVGALVAKKAATMQHWMPTDLVFPILEDGHGTFRISVSTPHQMIATKIAVKGVNTKLGIPDVAGLLKDPRQNFFTGEETNLSGWVGSDSSRVRQFQKLTKAQSRADVANYRNIPAAHAHADAITVAFYLPVAMEQVLRINNRSVRYYGESKAARSFGPQAMSAALEVASVEILIGAGGDVDEKHPDNPTVHPSDFQENAQFDLTFRMLPLAYYNDLAKAIEASEVTFEQTSKMAEAQKRFEQRIGEQLLVGHETNSQVDELPMFETLSL